MEGIGTLRSGWNRVLSKKETLSSICRLVTDLSEEYDLEEIRVFATRLGTKPQMAIDIHIGHGAGSSALAARIAQILAQKWNGFLESQDSLHGILPGDLYPVTNSK